MSDPLPGLEGGFSQGASGPSNVYDTSPTGLGLSPAYLAGGASASALASAGSGTVGTHASLPGTATTGATYYETDTGIFRIWDGSAWQIVNGMVKLWDSSDAAVALPAASITTPALPQTFKHLRVEMSARCDVAGADSTVYLRFNGDSTANYYDQVIDGTAAAAEASTSAAATVGRAGRIGAAAGAAAEMGSVSVLIPNYTGTHRKGWVGYSGGYGSAGFARVAAGEVVTVTAAVSTITFLTSGNFTANSRITVYGES